MNSASQAQALPVGRGSLVPLVVVGGIIAILFGLAAGMGTRTFLVPAGSIAGIGIVLGVLARPFAGFLVVAAASIFLPVVVLFSDSRGMNPFDLVLPPLLVASVLGTARVAALSADRSVRSGPVADILAAGRSLARSAVIFYGLAGLSIGIMIVDGRIGAAASAVLAMVRTWQGLLLFPLGLWWLRDEVRIRQTVVALLAAGGLFAIVNSAAILWGPTIRAGQTWFLNQPNWPIDSPNDGATGMLLLIALLIARQTIRPRFRNLLMIGIALAMMVMTQSRSGLLALITFTLMNLPRARLWFVLAGGLVIAAALPLVPPEYWNRLAGTLAMERGSFETYTAYIRFLHWEAAWAMFVAHPIFGVGYLGFESVSSQYNSLRLFMSSAESYYLEIAAGMGVIGLAALAVMISRFHRLGRVVARAVPAATFGHALARCHTPFLVALLVANLTGETLIGMANLAQLSIWSALLIRAGQQSAIPPASRPA